MIGHRIPPTRRPLVLPDSWDDLPHRLWHLASKVVSVELDHQCRAVVCHGPERIACDPRTLGLRFHAGTWFIPDALLRQTYQAQHALRRSGPIPANSALEALRATETAESASAGA